MQNVSPLRTGYELREGSAILAERAANNPDKRGRHVARYCGRGYGWFVFVETTRRAEPHGAAVWLEAAGPYTTREQAVAEADARNAADAEARQRAAAIAVLRRRNDPTQDAPPDNDNGGWSVKA